MKSFYNRMVLFLLAVIALVACGKQYEAEAALGGGTNVHNHSGGASGGGSLNLSGTLSSTKACASGYTRIGPNYCANVSNPAVAMTRDVCTTVARPHADAKALDIFAQAFAKSANLVLARYAVVEAFTTNACGPLLRNIAQSTPYESPAIVAGSLLGADQATVVVPVDGLGNVYLKLADDAGNFGAGSYGIYGYFD